MNKRSFCGSVHSNYCKLCKVLLFIQTLFDVEAYTNIFKAVQDQDKETMEVSAIKNLLE